MFQSGKKSRLQEQRIEASSTNFLEFFHQDQGLYRTQEIASFFATFVFNDEGEEQFVKKQFKRNLKNSCQELMTAQQLQRLATSAEYLQPQRNENVDPRQEKVLFGIYQQYLKNQGHQFQLSSQEKQKEFQKVLANIKF